MIQSFIQIIADILNASSFSFIRACGTRVGAVLTCVVLTFVVLVSVALLARTVVMRVLRLSKAPDGSILATRTVKMRAFNSAIWFCFILTLCWIMPLILERDFTSFAAALSRFLVMLSIVFAVPAISRAVDFLQLLAARHVRDDTAFSVKSAAQVTKVIVWCAAAVCIVAELFGQSPVYILSGMGALTAVLMLIFKDPIVGLVAGIQISQNDMIRLGDWIEVPKDGADGEVVEIALTTVKVRNWDNTVTMLPSYGLISGAFKNWRYMSESGGRRIKRSVRVDMRSIKFCTDEMLERFSRIKILDPYLDAKRVEIAADNKNESDVSVLGNGRKLTNIGVFEAYLRAYLKNNSQINQDLTLIVRQLSPTENGLPIEIYAFTKVKSWSAYEAIQTDIFDHVLAMMGQFDLSVYQRSAADIQH